MRLMESGIRKKMDLIIIAVQTNAGKMVFNPGADTVLGANDKVVAMGRARNLKRLESILGRN